MANGWILACKSCAKKYRFRLGCGFLFPKVYEETIKKAKKGELGKQIQSFLEKNPDGVIDCDKVLLRCDHCGLLFTDLDLAMYNPSQQYEPEPKPFWSIACRFEGAEYVTKRELEDHYDLVERYEHICPKCHAVMDVITMAEMEKKMRRAFQNEDQMSDIPCPECKKPLQLTGFMNWD